MTYQRHYGKMASHMLGFLGAVGAFQPQVEFHFILDMKEGYQKLTLFKILAQNRCLNRFAIVAPMGDYTTPLPYPNILRRRNATM